MILMLKLYLQDTFLKIKTILVDEKKHIRFGDWSALDVIINKPDFG